MLHGQRSTRKSWPKLTKRQNQTLSIRQRKRRRSDERDPAPAVLAAPARLAALAALAAPAHLAAQAHPKVQSVQPQFKGERKLGKL